ncbi:translation elongation factor EF2 methyltransferase Efm3 [Schizosaccharomyces osmophilus]|uniref:Translation elongation factor EF2 methyltransferase Efm3 n=1 Tax=Schizosaccharomyces osmophilus TaxID=2545709 RepID=A0AAE9WD14_9SCHI|nr:translation elongation factor EF2 methyltransferase Efm3 [Schizosaccharomyces osmophilus]WBW73618.1 translation elongation factor EF2 methyltransferase Efm3 [Schizosaccharomyces osmophilus]
MDTIPDFLQRVKQQYLQQVSLDQFQWVTSDIEWSVLVEPFTQAYLGEFLYPSIYTKFFLKSYFRLLDKHSQNHTEPDETLLYIYIESLSSREIPPVQYTLGDCSVQVYESQNILLRAGTTGVRTWEAGMALAELLYQNPINPGTRVLELGAGTGLVSILCSKMGASVLATDGDNKVCQGVEENAHLNECELSVQRLLWGVDPPVYADLVLASDVTYEGDLRCLATTMNDLTVVNPRCKILLAATLRRRETIDNFLRLISNFHVRVLTKKKYEKLLYYDSPPVVFYEIFR